MKFSLVVSFFLSWSFLAQADIEIFRPGCNLDLYQVGASSTTPLQQEAEWMLQVKGYRVQPREAADFDSGDLKPFQMFGSFRAGDVSVSGGSDCVQEDYKELGIRFTCTYEMNLVTVGLDGKLQTFATVAGSLRQAASEEGFYESIRAQLLALPSCGL